MNPTTIPIPNYPRPKAEAVEVKLDPVARSMAKPDACAKPCTTKPANSRVRVRVNNDRVRVRRKKRDKRDVQFY